jgi:hypothetical protein
MPDSPFMAVGSANAVLALAVGARRHDPNNLILAGTGSIGEAEEEPDHVPRLDRALGH